MPIINLVYEAPKPRTYSYDFRNKSVATLQSDGWTLSSTSIYFDSNGAYASGGMKTVGFSIDLTDAKKITITSTSTGSGTRDFSCGTGDTVDYTFGTCPNGIYYYNGGSSGYIGSTTTFNGGATSGLAEWTVEQDLVNKTTIYTCTQFSVNTTYNMSDAEVALVKQGTYLLAGFQNGVRLSDISITIEY